MDGTPDKIADDIYDYIVRFIAEQHVPPTMWEIAHAFNYKGTGAVRHHLSILERERRIRRTPYRTRGIVVLDRPHGRYQELVDAAMAAVDDNSNLGASIAALNKALDKLVDST